MLKTLGQHWPEYLIEAAGLGLFMLSAGLFVSLLESPGSIGRELISSPFVRRIPMGIAMGLTAIAIIYSPWGKRSGAHINPAVTLAFYRLGKVQGWDAAGYIAFQFAGGLTGMLAARLLLGPKLADPSVNYAVTVPGQAGALVAFLAESSLSFILMSTVLFSTNRARVAPYTGILAGLLVALFIIFEAPLSGMSINPARSFASALPAGVWHGTWIYVLAPILGMLAAAEVHLRHNGAARTICAKLIHQESQRCIFKCGYKTSLTHV